MKKTLHFLFALLITTAINAQTVGDVFTVDNIEYTVTSVGPNEAEVSAYTGTDASLMIPATATNIATQYSITAIGSQAFMSNGVITDVTLPASVVTLKSEAFSSSTLSTINLENVVSIELKAFVACPLTEVGVLSSCKTIGNYAFNKAFRAGLTTIEIPVLETMGAGSLYDSDQNGSSLIRISIPSTLTSSGTLFLGGHNNLVAVQVNWTDPANCSFDDVTDPSSSRFFRWLDKSNITVYVPSGTEALYEAHAHWGMFPDENIVEGILPTVGNTFVANNIKYVVTSEAPNEAMVLGFEDPSIVTIDLDIPTTATDVSNSMQYNVVSIGDNAFTSDTDLETVTLPSTVETIGSNAFKLCRNMTYINLNDVVTIGASAFHTCDKMSDIGGALSKLTTLGNYVFYKCNNITTFETPSLVTIGSGNVYTMAKLAQYNVPASVTSIGALFLGTDNSVPHILTTVTVNWTDPDNDVTIDPTNFFRNIDISDGSITLYVPVDTEELYEAHALWGEIPDANIIEGTPTSFNSISELELSFYPNPVKDVLTIKGEQLENAVVSIYNIAGSLVYSETIGSSVSQLNIASLNAGVYIVKVEADNAVVETRIVKK